MKTNNQKPEIVPVLPEALVAFRAELAAVVANSKNLTDRNANAAFLLGLRLDEAGRVMAKFNENVAVNPSYAFEWADAAFMAGATMEFIGRIAAHAKSYLLSDGSPQALGECLFEAASDFVTDLSERVMKNEFRGNSTSVTHNAMMAARQEVACTFCGDRAFRASR